LSAANPLLLQTVLMIDLWSLVCLEPVGLEPQKPWLTWVTCIFNSKSTTNSCDFEAWWYWSPSGKSGTFYLDPPSAHPGTAGCFWMVRGFFQQTTNHHLANQDLQTWFLTQFASSKSLWPSWVQRILEQIRAKLVGTANVEGLWFIWGLNPNNDIWRRNNLTRWFSNIYHSDLLLTDTIQ